MKVKYGILLFALFAMSCTEDKVIKVAETYVSENICPLFENAELSDELKGKKHRLSKFKRNVYHVKDISDRNQCYTYLSEKIAIVTSNKYEDSPEKFRERLLIQELYLASLSALYDASLSEGFYSVNVSVQHNSTMPRMSISSGKSTNVAIEYFTIIVSKDLKILNPPVDLDEIDKVIECTEFVKSDKSEKLEGGALEMH